MYNIRLFYSGIHVIYIYITNSKYRDISHTWGVIITGKYVWYGPKMWDISDMTEIHITTGKSSEDMDQ